MSDFREMLFSETIKPLNWQDLQARDEELQKEIDEQLEKDDEQLEQDDDYLDSGMSRSDFYSGGTF
tara:strand:- start:245 stop:442 length:198 start_codon:yes stop_codon:yes gene_type:complete